MPSDQLPRRFAPTPVETTAKSSRQGAQANGDAPRRFPVQPIETSARAHRENSSLNGEPDSTNSPPRRFSPQPVETSTKSSKEKTQAPRRFAPEPVETSSRSNSKSGTGPEKPKSRFLPQPIETTARTNRTESPPKPTETDPQSTSGDRPARRKFAPQLIDTSARTRRATEVRAYSAADKTDSTPGHNKQSYHNSGQKLEVAEHPSAEQHARFLMPYERRKERSDSHSTRSHSFRLPDLETIESSESEPSNPPSLSTSPSSSDVALGTLAEVYKHATRIRESIDETFGRYLLELEARRAQQKLQDQALAAFPNSDFHEPVTHYVDEESEGDELDDRPATWEGHEDEDMATNFPRSGRATTHGTFEVREMQQHHEELEQERKAAGTTARRKSSASPWWNPAAHDFTGSVERDPELGKMRDRARPPMLGSDLRFPRSASPEPARFDVTQGSHQLRSQMCYLTEQSETNVSPEGLWGGKKEESSDSKSKSRSQMSQRSTHSNRSTQSQSQGGGLWGGFCYENNMKPGGLAPPTGPTGLMTPRNEPENPFESADGWKLPPPTTLPVTPPEIDGQGPRIDVILSDDKDLDELVEREYPDSFVTQVFNYLSLGYPTLARPFDEELSKISLVPISELRHDDEIAKSMPKGYIRLGDDFEGRGDGVDQELQEGGCARWRALKKYIREWARQEKDMVKTEGQPQNWGTGARRGSWAW